MDSFHSGQAQANLALYANTAADLMSKNPISIRRDATIAEAAALLVEREISAAPVIDDAGHAIGVISHTDIARHESEAAAKALHDVDFYREVDRRCPPALRDVVYGAKGASAQVGDAMSPVVIDVSVDEPAVSVVAKLLALKIHRLFVVDRAGTLVGVISTLDVLRCLQRPAAG